MFNFSFLRSYDYGLKLVKIQSSRAGISKNGPSLPFTICLGGLPKTLIIPSMPMVHWLKRDILEGDGIFLLKYQLSVHNNGKCDKT